MAYNNVVAIKDANLDVAAGSMASIVGANGAGKTTLLNTISGVVKSASGTIRFDGQQIARFPGHKVAQMGIVQVPEGRQILAPLTVEENLRLGHLAAQDRSKNINQDLERVLELFPMLRDRLGTPAEDLSGGQQQLLALAMTLIRDPEVLIIDELSLGLAPVVVQQVLDIVRTLKERGLTMIIVEQSLNVALSICDRAIFMEKGEIRFEGPAEELAARDDLARAVFLGS